MCDFVDANRPTGSCERVAEWLVGSSDHRTPHPSVIVPAKVEHTSTPHITCNSSVNLGFGPGLKAHACIFHGPGAGLSKGVICFLSCHHISSSRGEKCDLVCSVFDKRWVRGGGRVKNVQGSSQHHFISTSHHWFVARSHAEMQLDQDPARRVAYSRKYDLSYFTASTLADELLDKLQRSNCKSHHVCLSVVPQPRFEVLAQFSVFPNHCHCNVAPSAPKLLYQPSQHNELEVAREQGR